ncbi:MAG: NACHT domain-containing protein [Chloroflexales bacterium]|nr:NACHT domain-containing protein [Chloroflexales bacterium]
MRLEALAIALVAASQSELPPDEGQSALPEHVELLRELSGRTVTSGGVSFSFNGAQIGDVQIGNVAGGDIITVNFAQAIITAEQLYQVADLPNPYRGLRPFTYADRESFAGRERLVAAALALLTVPGGERALLFVTGASGSGKSSFVQAGLIPALEAYYQVRALTLCHAVMRPSKQPLAALADALHQLGIPPEASFAAATPFVLGSPVGRRQDVAVLVIDQFEELFTQSAPTHRDALLDLLAALPSFRELCIHVICTLRSDFLSELAERHELEPAFREQVLLRVMDEDELRAAIQRPIQQAQLDKRIEPALLDRLAADAAGEASYLPLLQVTLEDLWRRGTLSLGAYGSLTDAIRDRAEQVYAFQDYDGARQHARSAAEQTILLGLLLDLVDVSLDDESRRDVQRRRSLAELTRGDVERERLAQNLATARLLSIEVEVRDGAEIEVVDLIHESLIANWERLRGAIAQQREALQRRVRFEWAFRQWLSRGKSNNYLLEGWSLDEANLLEEVGDIALRRQDAQEFLQNSVIYATLHDERLRRKRFRNALREWIANNERDAYLLDGVRLDEAYYLAATQDTALDSEQARELLERSIARRDKGRRQQLRSTRIVAVSLVLVLVMSVFAAGWAQDRSVAVQRVVAQADAQLRISDSQRLAFASQSRQHMDQDLAILLAYEAVNLDENPTSVQTLRAVAQVSGTKNLQTVPTNELLQSAACRVGRGLTEDEILEFNVPTPVAFDFAHRQCPLDPSKE